MRKLVTKNCVCLPACLKSAHLLEIFNADKLPLLSGESFVFSTVKHDLTHEDDRLCMA